ncbi:lppC lipofamily protein, partial [Escherichia coli 93.0056]|jgi:hypothetical protein
LAI